MIIVIIIVYSAPRKDHKKYLQIMKFTYRQNEQSQTKTSTKP